MVGAFDRNPSIKTISDENSVKWGAEQLLINYAFWADGKHVLPDQATTLSKMVIISTAIVQLEAAFTDTMQVLLTYARAF